MKYDLLVTLADNKYIQQAKQLFSSVYWNAGWEGDYMLLAHDIPDEELRWFQDKGILIKKCELIIEKGWGENNELPPIIADKFYLFTEEFRKWKNIVYLDSDIIVKAPLDRLTKIKYFGAVQNYYFSKLHTQFHNPKKNSFNNKTYNLNISAFNAGVISFNTDIITPDIFNELNNLLKDNNSEFIYGEQTALNIYFYKKWEKLPLIYNVFLNFHNYKLPKKIKCIIQHFISRRGYPALWDTENSFYHEWEKSLEKAEFIDLNKIQKVKKWNIFKIKYYSLLLNIYIIPDKIKSSFLYVIILKTSFRNIIKTPDRIIGKIGGVIKKNNPDLYRKLKKVKGGK